MKQKRLSAAEYDAEFDRLSRAIVEAPFEELDAARSALAAFLATRECETSFFLVRADERRLQTASTVLDEAATQCSSARFLAALEFARLRFPSVPLDGALEASRAAFARSQLEPLRSGQSATDAYAEQLSRAESGSALAQWQAALRLWFGLGTKRDRKGARLWAEKAFAQGFAPAAFFAELDE